MNSRINETVGGLSIGVALVAFPFAGATAGSEHDRGSKFSDS